MALLQSSGKGKQNKDTKAGGSRNFIDELFGSSKVKAKQANNGSVAGDEVRPVSAAAGKANTTPASFHHHQAQPEHMTSDEHQHLQQQEEEVPSSRLCVKGLPKYFTADKLREHFSVQGDVTDVKIMKTRDGVSRQMGFVGFKSVEQAKKAHSYFNKTYIDASRIFVEYAKSYKDPTLARPWSKHSEGSSAHKKQEETKNKEVDGSMAEATALLGKLKARDAEKHRKSKKKNIIEELTASDPQLAEFLALMAPRSRAKLWANDELAPVQTLEDLKERIQAVQGQDGDDGEDAAEHSSDDEYQELGQGAGGFGRIGKSKDAGDGAGSESEHDDQDMENAEQDEAANTALQVKDTVVVSEAVSDLDYLKSRMKKWDDNDDDDMLDVPAADMKDDQTVPGETGNISQVKQKEGGADGDADDDRQEAGMHDDNQNDGTDHGSDQHVNTEAAGKPDPHASIADPDSAVRTTSRLFLRNLAYTVTETDIMELAGNHGDVTSVHLVIDKESKKSKGVAYIQYASPEHAVNAYHAMDGLIFQGRLLHVLPAKAPLSGVVAVEDANAHSVDQDGDGKNKAGSSYKAEQEEKRKTEAGNRAAWNSLFMRPDTVQEAIAAHYGVSKSELMDARASGDLAVRVALGEAAIIQKTKTALAEEGVNVESLESAASAGGKAAASKAVARSATCLLVKNLPYTTTEDELVELFSRSGPVLRCVLPPTRTLALVEFAEPQDARSAFKALAYKKFQHVPLYLEWSPKDIFTTPAPSQPLKAQAQAVVAAAQEAAATATQQQQQQAKHEAALSSKATAQPEVVAAADHEDDDSCTIYVKNLAFATTDASIKKHFDKAVAAAGGVLHSARVSKRKHPNTGEMLSAGFGFVEVDSPGVAAAVIKQLQGSLLDHHKLSLQLSKKKPGDAGAGAATAGKPSKVTATPEAGAAGAKPAALSGSGTTKLVVRNVAFEATRNDIVGLFSPFGHLKSCRLPKKFDGKHRGFAFVEYVTKQEARNATEGVTGTHLYGRRLVVEFAKDDETLEDLRAKTAAKSKADVDTDALAGNARPAKKVKK